MINTQEANPQGTTQPLCTFDVVDMNLSCQIYQAFTAGKVINKQEYLEKSGSYQYSSLYAELLKHPDHYGALYQHLGYELEFSISGEFVTIKDRSGEGVELTFDEQALKIQAFLIIIGRYCTHRGRDLAGLGQLESGITINDLKEIDKDNKHSAILKALKFSNAIDALGYIKKRNFAFSVTSSRFVLSKGAMHMIDYLLKQSESTLSA